jgi:chemotaxis protein CheD
LNTTPYSVLFSDMDPEAANGIVTRLKNDKMPYTLDEGGRTIRVPAARLDEVRLQVAGQGMPASGRIGFEIFDRTSFGQTDFLEHVNYRRALEGELARTIGTIAEVANARVHIAMGRPSLFAGPAAAEIFSARPRRTGGAGAGGAGSPPAHRVPRPQPDRDGSARSDFRFHFLPQRDDLLRQDDPVARRVDARGPSGSRWVPVHFPLGKPQRDHAQAAVGGASGVPPEPAVMAGAAVFAGVRDGDGSRRTVGIGEFAVSDVPMDTIVTHALGSCIAVCIWDPATAVGGLLHFLLPDSAINPDRAKIQPATFADSGLPLLFQAALGLDKKRCRVRLVGGAEVANPGGAGSLNVGKRNLLAARNILWRNGLLIEREAVGGALPRSVTLHLSSGVIDISRRAAT